MSDELLINVMPGEIRAAVVGDGRLVELFVERQRRASQVGNVYLGRVERVLPGMDAAFVDLGTGRAGFIGLDAARQGNRDIERIADALTEGQAITVQVIKDAIGRKGAQIARRLTMPGRLLVYTPGQSRLTVSRQIGDEAEQERLLGLMEAIAEPDEGFILRTAAAGVGAAELERDAEYLRALWIDVEAARDQAEAPALIHAELDPLARIFRDEVNERMAMIRIDDAVGLAEARRFCARFMPEIEARLALHDGPEPIFARYDVEEEIERAGEPRLALPSGGGIVIEATEALTAIDVNSGRFTGASRLEETALQTNLEAAEEVARQVRLRNIGGLIVIDFIHMEDEDNWETVLDELERWLAQDRTHSRLLGCTAAGLVEVTRRRRRESLAQATTETCSPCAGTGRVMSADSVAHDVLRRLQREAGVAAPGSFAVVACDVVIDALEGAARPAYDALAERLGRKVVLRRDGDYERGRFEIVVEPDGQWDGQSDEAV